MKTPMQEHIEWLKNERTKHINKAHEESSERMLGFVYKMDDCIKHAELMLEKEKEVIENAYWDGGQWVPTSGSQCEEYYNEIFNTKECYHKGKYTYNKETFECHKCGLIVPNEYRFNTEEK